MGSGESDSGESFVTSRDTDSNSTDESDSDSVQMDVDNDDEEGDYPFCGNDEVECCLICGLSLTLLASNRAVVSEGVDDEKVFDSAWNIFLLKKVLQFPQEECENLMRTTKGLDPSKWFSVCDSCGTTVNTVFGIYRQITELEGNIQTIREDVEEKFKECLEQEISAPSEFKQKYSAWKIRKYFKRVHFDYEPSPKFQKGKHGRQQKQKGRKNPPATPPSSAKPQEKEKPQPTTSGQAPTIGKTTSNICDTPKSSPASTSKVKRKLTRVLNSTVTSNAERNTDENENEVLPTRKSSRKKSKPISTAPLPRLLRSTVNAEAQLVDENGETSARYKTRTRIKENIIQCEKCSCTFSSNEFLRNHMINKNCRKTK